MQLAVHIAIISRPYNLFYIYTHIYLYINKSKKYMCTEYIHKPFVDAKPNHIIHLNKAHINLLYPHVHIYVGIDRFIYEENLLVACELHQPSVV